MTKQGIKYQQKRQSTVFSSDLQNILCGDDGPVGEKNGVTDIVNPFDRTGDGHVDASRLAVIGKEVGDGNLGVDMGREEAQPAV